MLLLLYSGQRGAVTHKTVAKIKALCYITFKNERKEVLTVLDIFYENKISPISRMQENSLSRLPHLHKELEAIYVFKGKAVAYADKNSYLLNAGDTFITFPNQIHYYDTLQNGKYLVVIFSPDILYRISGEISKCIPDTNFIPAGNRIISQSFKSISEADGEYADVAINGYLNIFMSAILPELTLKTVSAESTSAFYSIIDFCSHNFKEELTLDLVADSLHLSKYYISHLINKKLSQSFSEYINNLRISEACNLLKESSMKIADISEDVGFGTIRSFNRSFKQIMKVSPAEYRSNIAALKKSI